MKPFKEIIKQYVPGATFLWRRGYSFYKKQRSKNTELIFTEKFEKNGWGSSESLSGYGSELKQTQKILGEMPGMLSKYEIRSILDIPCGDFHWLQRLNYTFSEYVGADIVKELIQINRQKYSSFGEFKVLNLLFDRLPHVDLVFCRDCLVHLSNPDIKLAIDNIKRSGSKYLLTTTYTDHENSDILTGDWRHLNLERPPFNFGRPMELLNEGSTESGNKSDKCLALWLIKSL